ncbi:uncharacterized protein LOC128327750 [Hemicordylus capensis]|uniref:uncharacterized protein LOC128327750 n=1 Tax=Hemicordylus capensis TaxID=884348 RepID=UPI0023038FFD|nr:uncharacterized protein LOC128327750 [Hemicordylus capensis]XP_053112943.1 uncharacterized protein LOC128327750 [Hemicordylus capensis]
MADSRTLQHPTALSLPQTHLSIRPMTPVSLSYPPTGLKTCQMADLIAGEVPVAETNFAAVPMDEDDKLECDCGCSNTKPATPMETEDGEPSATASKEGNIRSSDSETEAPVKQKLRRKKKLVKKRPQYFWCNDNCCHNSEENLSEDEECRYDSWLSSRSWKPHCRKLCCLSSENWSSCDCLTPISGSPLTARWCALLHHLKVGRRKPWMALCLQNLKSQPQLRKSTSWYRPLRTCTSEMSTCPAFPVCVH